MKQFLKIIYVIFLCTVSIAARFHLVQRADDFNRLLKKYDYSIACFSFSGQSDYMKTSLNDQDLQMNFDTIKNRMIAASKKDIFADSLVKNVGFLMVDLAKPGNKKLFKDFAMVFTEFPCMMFFDQDVLTHLLVQTPQSATQIIDFLNKEFGNNLQQLVRDQDRVRVTMPNYYQYESSPYAWYPYAVWPYSRWGIRPYEIGYGLELAEYT